jgi:hypothetical protein
VLEVGLGVVLLDFFVRRERVVAGHDNFEILPRLKFCVVSWMSSRTCLFTRILKKKIHGKNPWQDVFGLISSCWCKERGIDGRISPLPNKMKHFKERKHYHISKNSAIKLNARNLNKSSSRSLHNSVLQYVLCPCRTHNRHTLP